MFVIGLGGAIITLETGNISVSITGMSLAAITGIILNLFLPKNIEDNNTKDEKKIKMKKIIKRKINAK